MTTTDTAPATTYTCAVVARDFSSSTADTRRDVWTVGNLQTLLEALDGQPVVITTDKMTGHTVVGAVLVGTQFGTAYSGGGEGRVLVRTEGRTTAYRTEDIGPAIIPLGQPATRLKAAKWVATSLHREMVGAAIAAERAVHGEAKGNAWGSWKAERLSATEVDVTYTPHTGNAAFSDQWGARHWGRVRIVDGQYVASTGRR